LQWNTNCFLNLLQRRFSFQRFTAF